MRLSSLVWNFHTITSILKRTYKDHIRPLIREFPYDYVYFKARVPVGPQAPRRWYFHTITSILKQDKRLSSPEKKEKFPYDYVYFKAQPSPSAT